MQYNDFINAINSNFKTLDNQAYEFLIALVYSFNEKLLQELYNELLTLENINILKLQKAYEKVLNKKAEELASKTSLKGYKYDLNLSEYELLIAYFYKRLKEKKI